MGEFLVSYWASPGLKVIPKHNDFRSPIQRLRNTAIFPIEIRIEAVELAFKRLYGDSILEIIKSSTRKLVGKRSSHQAAEIRMLFAYLTFGHVGEDYKALANLMGKDRTSIYYYLDRAAHLYANKIDPFYSDYLILRDAIADKLTT